MKPEVVDTDYLLNSGDRCDVCQAQAYVYVKFESGDLLFCLHHWNDNKKIAELAAVEVVDESARLLLR